jgi:ABC-type glucose/galactose transport system permease subunit
LVSRAGRKERVAVNIKIGVGHLVLLNGVHLQHQSVQVAGVMFTLGADLHHLVVVSWGAAVLARVLQKGIRSCKLFPTAINCADKRLFACMRTHVANHLVVLVEGLLLDNTVLPFAGILGLLV